MIQGIFQFNKFNTKRNIRKKSDKISERFDEKYSSYCNLNFKLDRFVQLVFFSFTLFCTDTRQDAEIRIRVTPA